jgi:transposase
VDCESATDPDAKIAKMKDGTTHPAYKPEHAVDLDTGVIVAAPIHPADEGDTTTPVPTLEAAARNLGEVGLAPIAAEPCVVVADKGYHSRERLKALEGGVWKTRIAEPEPPRATCAGHGDEDARRAVHANRVRLRSGIGRETMRRRGELVERSFAHILDRGGMRRAWLMGGKPAIRCRTKTRVAMPDHSRQQAPLLSQRVEQSFRLPQVERVETFREPAIDGREEVAGLVRLALIAP